MKLTLTIEASAQVIATVLAALPQSGVEFEVAPSRPLPAVGSPEPGGTALSAPLSPLPVPTPPAAPVAAPGGMVATPPLAPAAVPTNGEDDDGPADANAPDVDKHGLPWDERIHSSNHALNADGSWRKRRGVDTNLITSVEAELRARDGGAPAMPSPPAPVPIPTAMPMQPTVTPVAPAPLQDAPVPMPQPVPTAIPVMPTNGEGAAPAPVPVPIPPQQAAVAAATPEPIPPQQAAVAAATGDAIDFPTFMQHISKGTQTADPATGAPLIHADYLAGVASEVSTAFGKPLSSIMDIASDAAMITYAMQCLQRDGKWLA